MYVRFFRMAERRIAENTGQGVACFISNYSWLDRLSFTGVRECYLEAFGAIRVDRLHGNKCKTNKVASHGASDPSVFSSAGDPVGIQVGPPSRRRCARPSTRRPGWPGFATFLGMGQSIIDGDGRRGTERALRCDDVRILARPAVRPHHGEQDRFDWQSLQLTGSLPGVVPRREDQPRRVSCRRRS